jgi:hypothetical protein
VLIAMSFHLPCPCPCPCPVPVPSFPLRRALFTCLLAIGFVLLAVCEPLTAHAQEPPPAEQQQVVVRGVLFGADGLPQQDAEISLGEQETTTDSDGAFTFTVQPGDHVLEFQGNTQTLSVGTVAVEVLVRSTSTGVVFDVEGAETDESREVAETEEETQSDVVQTGTVSGVVTSDEGGPVEGVRVFVRGLDVEATTDAEGRYTLGLPEGEHALAFVHAEYSSLDRSAVQVSADETTTVDVGLVPAAVALEDYTVTAPRIEGGTAELLQERKDSDAVTEVIGAEEMSRTGASDAADAVTRVTGITVVGGKYVYVRGLGDRYSSTLLNGASLPSPEPERRVVPLDLFPTDLLESVLVQKTFSPDMPGEFGGGVVVLRTRDYPDEFEAEIGLSTSYDSSATFQAGLDSTGGSLDYFGFDDGTRRMPGDLREASEDAPLKQGDRFGGGGYTTEELEAFGESVPNTWEVGDRTLLPNLGLQGSIGDGFSLFGAESGYRLGLTFDHSVDHQTREQNYYVVGAGGELERSNSYEFTTTNDNVVLGGILTTGLVFDEENSIKLTSVIDRVSDAEDRVYAGFNRDADTRIRVTRYRWLERQLLFEQLKGEHELDSGIGFDWHYVFSQARRLEPDRRETRYDLRPDGEYRLSDRPEGNSRVFSNLVDNAHDVSASTEVPFSLGSLEPTVSAGGGAVFKDRAVDTRRFKYFGDSLDSELLAKPPDELFVPDNIGPDGFQFLEITRPTDNYTASQRVYAGWIDSSWPLFDGFEAGLGARIEYSDQRVSTFELFNPAGNAVEARLQTADILPAARASYELTDDMKLRAAGSRTVSRPDFRELSPMLFNDVTGGIAVQGNPDLNRALITHVDLRWEWYPSRSESFSVGGFFKHFDDPIESILVPGAQQLKTFENAEAARNLGVEVEARKDFGFVTEALRDAWFAGNVSLIDSRIQLDPTSGIQTSTERPLQGQSPWVVNAQLGWDAVEAGTSVALLFNVVGPRIREVGAQGAPDIYEEAVPRLDLVFRQKLGDTFKLGIKAKNLIDPEVRFTQGDRVVSSVRKGRSFSLSLGADF